MKKSFGSRIPGILITVLLTVALTLFAAILVKTKLLPSRLLLLAGGLFLVFVLCVFLLTRDSRRTGGMVAGSVLTILILVVLMVGTPYLTKAVNTLGSMTGVNVEVADMGVYVKNDSSIQDLAELSGKTMGIMDVLDRENTDAALEEIRGEIGALNVAEYPGLGELVDGLLIGETEAIVLNTAYLDLLADMEGYESAAAQLREIHAQKTETVIESVQENKNDGWNFMDLFSGSEEEAQNNDRVFTMYISGIDSRSGLIAKSRSDVNILATVNVDTRQVLLVSTPRDYYVPLPISNGAPDKLTHAGIYGVDVSMGTLEMLYGIDIDYYFRVNFSGFEKIIDALGGITVYSDTSFTSNDGYTYYEGENNLNGTQALSFARQRDGLSGGDRARGTHQMAVIKAVIDKAMSPAILSGYADLMESVAGNFETSMPYDVIAELVRDQLDKGGSWNIVSCSVDGTGDTRRPYSMSQNAYVMIPDQATVDAAIEKINQVKNGEILE